MSPALNQPLKQRWRWCIGCHILLKDYPSKFCPFDDCYLSDSRPPHVPTLLRNAETGHVIKEAPPSLQGDSR